MSQTSKTPPVPGPDSKGHPDSGRERTETELEKGLPPNQRRGPQDKSDTRPIPDKSPQDS